jgi:hypothetical protein
MTMLKIASSEIASPTWILKAAEPPRPSLPGLQTHAVADEAVCTDPMMSCFALLKSASAATADKIATFDRASLAA